MPVQNRFPIAAPSHSAVLRSSLLCGALTRVIISTGLASALNLPGCGGADFPDIRVPIEHQYAVSARAPAPLAIPRDQPFAIHIKQSSQNPGANGQAKAESDARPQGSAFCHVESSHGGGGTAEFTIGQRVDHRLDQAQWVDVQVQYELKQAVEITQPPANETHAAAELSLLVLDGHRKAIARIPVLVAPDDGAAGQAVTHDERVLSVIFAPRQSYDVVLYGKVEAATAGEQSAQARLDLSNVRMRLAFRPVATAPARSLGAQDD